MQRMNVPTGEDREAIEFVCRVCLIESIMQGFVQSIENSLAYAHARGIEVNPEHRTFLHGCLTATRASVIQIAGIPLNKTDELPEGQ